MEFDVSFLAGYLDVLLLGLLTSLRIVAVAMALGLVLGFAVSLMRSFGGPAIHWPATVYVELFRGTPVLVQLFWIFFCLPAFFGTELSAFLSGAIALTLYFGAITSETFRSSIRSIEATQIDACVALGLGPVHRVTMVVLPQAVLRAVPTLSSNIVSLFKESALVSAVGLADLMYVGQNIANNEGRPIEVLSAVALIYFVVAFPLTRLAALLERRLLRVVKV